MEYKCTGRAPVMGPAHVEVGICIAEEEEEGLTVELAEGATAPGRRRLASAARRGRISGRLTSR
ncbi:hypothetical protein EYF80_056638 [Liparis tanakae]|uniref:Uncharacterized protein n=1 Tax=Liparis tanakae TaxID=230148 RepID=A0A4Z2EWK6_9TELE|nr:hypothetical protein EYF80_056638 [Liparis tanakae]